MGVLHEDEQVISAKVTNFTEQGTFKSFIIECNALRKIRHVNLVQMLTVYLSLDFRGNDFKALVLKFMPSRSFDNWLHPSSDGRNPTRALSLLERLNIAIDIAYALNYLHNCFGTPVMHCDLKPSNILLDKDMNAHMGDFGLAKFLSRLISNFMDNEIKSIFARGANGYISLGYGTGAEVSTQGKRPTDDIFKDGLTLHDLLSTAFILRVMDIMDQELISEEANSVADASSRRDVNDKV